jgi:hypothetical protein
MVRSQGAYVIFGGVHAHCIPKRPLTGEECTQWSRVTATLRGEGRLPIAATEFPNPSTLAGRSKPAISSPPAGI